MNWRPIDIAIPDAEGRESLNTYRECAVQKVVEEWGKALEQHAPYPTLHHAISAILEEFEELKQEAYWGEPAKDAPSLARGRHIVAMEEEATHLASAVLHLLTDLLIPMFNQHLEDSHNEQKRLAQELEKTREVKR